MRLTIGLLLFVIVLKGQTTLLEKTYGGALTDQLIDVEPMDDGGFSLLGVTFSYGNGGNDYYLVRINSFGDTLWTKTFGAGENDSGMSLLKTSNDGLILAGTKVLNSKGNGWIIKISSTGIVEWEKTYGGSGNDYFRDIIKTKKGNYLACGFTNSSGSGSHDAYVVKIDASGNVLWEQTIGGSLSDEGRKILELEDNKGFVVVGLKTTSLGKDYLVSHLDSLGNVLWSKNYGNTGDDVAWDVCQTENGVLNVTGEGYNNSNSSKDFWLCKIDLNGSLIADNYYGGVQDDLGRAVVSVGDSLYLFGQTSSFGNGKSDLFLLSIDTNGTEYTSNTFGSTGVETAWTMKSTGSNLLLAGNFDTESSTGIDFYFLNLELTKPSGIDLEFTSDIQLFPTISSNLMTLVSPKYCEVLISNSLGQVVKQLTTQGVEKNVFTVDGLSSGLYALSVYKNDQLIAVVRFIKQ